MPLVVMLSVIMPGVAFFARPTVIKPNAIMMSVIMLSVILLGVGFFVGSLSLSQMS